MELIDELTFDLWKKTLIRVKENGVDFKDSDGRICRELLNLALRINNPKKDIEKPLRIMRGLNNWIYPSTDELQTIMLNKNFSIGYDYSYGPRIFGADFKIDQINQFVIPMLKSNPNTRKAGISLYDYNEDSKIENDNLPSLIYIHLKIQNNTLVCTAIVRSCDLFVGFPANVYQIYSLQDHIATKLKIETGFLSIFCCSAHIFNDQFENIEKIV